MKLYDLNNNWIRKSQRHISYMPGIFMPP